MNTQARWQRIKELFAQSQQQPESQREAWLVAQYGDDRDLLHEVRGLLAAQRATAGILDDGAIEVLRRLHEPQPATSLVGQSIGAYRLLRLIGEGGMGSVYLAEREDGDFTQHVALKLVRADFVSAETRARFLRERNFLARLVHPHIAQLHDGGMAADGTPYFTLEFVEGEAITRYCDAHALDIRQRVQLVLQVCSAIAYAHRNLIVHRDLKPSNILVAADGQTKLLDFGIAKLLDTESIDGGTATQSRMMTPEYAAPEQVLGEPITTATDVYAIGVLLYELLCGRLPYARADAGAISWAKAVVEETPESISRALSRTIGSKKNPTGDSVAASRGSTLPTLRRTLRGDLDRIVQRALAKEPESRYSSVSAFADDLRAFVGGRAISGGSQRYRLRKFMRRHWLPLTAAATILMILIVSGAAIVWQARQTEHEARTTLAVKDFLFGLFAAVDPHEAKGREVTAHELLDRGTQRIDRNRILDAQQKAEIEAALGRIYYQLGLFDQADKLQEDAIKVLAINQTQDLLLAQTLAERADTLTERGDLKAAATLAEQAHAKVDASSNATITDRIRVYEVQANVAKIQRDFVAAKRYSDSGLALARRPEVEQSLVFRALMTAGGTSWGLTQYDDAEAFFREALALALRDAGPDDLDVAKARGNIGTVLQSKSRYAEAEQIETLALATDEKILGADHPLSMTLRRDLGLSYYHLGHYAQARAALEQVLAAQRTKLGSEHPALAGTEINLGLALIDSGNLDAADRMLSEAVAIFEKKYGRDYEGTRIALGDLAVVHTQQGKLDLAETELTEVREREKNPGQAEMNGFINEYRLGEVKRLQGDTKAALDLEHSALTAVQQKNGDNSRHAALAHQNLALALRDSGDFAAAEREFRAALASYAGYIPHAEHPLAATTRYELGMLLIKQDETRAEGIRLLSEAVDLRAKFLGADEPRTRQARAALLKAQAATKI